MTAKVYFGSLQHGKPNRFASLGAKMEKILENLDFSSIEKKDNIKIQSSKIGNNSGLFKIKQVK